MIITCATDDNFVQHCCIMLVSLLLNNDDVEIYILTEGLKPQNERIIRDEVGKYNAKINFRIVDTDVVSKFPLPNDDGLKHISRATYYRLFMAELLPEEVHKVIYLDCDIIVDSSIQELWDIDISKYAIAAVPQVGSGFEATRLGYPIEYGYFNAGVNVLNLDYFRKTKVSEQLINYISTNYSNIKYHDQDTLNAVLYDKCLHILPQWNMSSVAYISYLDKHGDSLNGHIINDYKTEKANIKQFRRNPPILHYVSKPKPWNRNCVHPLYNKYYEYARKTINFSHIKPQPRLSRLPAIVKQYLISLLSEIKQTIVKTDPSRI